MTYNLKQEMSSHEMLKVLTFMVNERKVKMGEILFNLYVFTALMKHQPLEREK